jgi:ABC-type lipopolysaccharide export system ATPase subunit
VDIVTAPSAADVTSAAETPVLTCRDLGKSYGDLVAVRDLSLRIADGETYGLLGPNGAGKTTAISMIAGVLEPDAGEIVVAGEPLTVRAVRTKRHIGYVPQEIAVYPDLTARSSTRRTTWRRPNASAIVSVSWTRAGSSRKAPCGS